jgi:hypothetical protein
MDRALVHLPRSIAKSRDAELGTTARPRPEWSDVVKVAARASVDPVTVLRYLDGKPSRSTTRKRIELGLVKCGLAAYVRAADRRA